MIDKEKRREIMAKEILDTIEEAVEQIRDGYQVPQNLTLIKDCCWAYERLLGV